MTRMGVRFWAAAVFVVLAAASMGGWAAWRMLNTPLRMSGDEEIWVEIVAGSALSRVVEELTNRGVLDHPRLFLSYARLRGDATRVRAGEYRLTPDMSAVSLLEHLVAGRVYLHRITVIEGSRASDLLESLHSHPAVAQTVMSVGEAMVHLGAEELHPEGQFFPDTYHFPRGTTDLELLRLAHAAMQRELAEAWAARLDDVQLTSMYEALILASIIEKEARLASERPLISGVLLRRLRRNMRLQTDPTVIYGLGSAYDGDLRDADLIADTPYNTYMRVGLPPTPISLPGRGALRAAVAPDAGDALYFVATGDPDGSHFFSATLDEHNAAVQRYLKRLRDGAQ
jgi:UPF0755 protein